MADIDVGAMAEALNDKADREVRIDTAIFQRYANTYSSMYAHR